MSAQAVAGLTVAAAWVGVLVWAIWPNIKNSKTIQRLKELGWWLSTLTVLAPLGITWNTLHWHGWSLAINAVWTLTLYWGFRNAHLRGEIHQLDLQAEREVARMVEDLRRWRDNTHPPT